MSVPGGQILKVRGNSDGIGAGFMILRADGVSFGYATGLLPNLHVTPALPASGGDSINISSFGGRFGLFVFSNQTVYGVATGCAVKADAAP